MNNESIQPLTQSDNNSKGNDTGAMLGIIFLVLSLILSIIFSIATLIRGQGQDSSKMIILCSWIIFGSLFSYIIVKNSNTGINLAISSFVIMISCVLTCTQVGIISTRII